MDYAATQRLRASLTLMLTDKVQTIRLVGKPKTITGHWFRLRRDDGTGTIVFRQCSGRPCPYCRLTDRVPMTRVACNVEVGSRLLIQSSGLAAWLRLAPVARPLKIVDLTSRIFIMAANEAQFDSEHGNRSCDLHVRKRKLNLTEELMTSGNVPSPFVFRAKGPLREEPARTDLHDLDVLFAPMDYDAAVADAKAIEPMIDPQ